MSQTSMLLNGDAAKRTRGRLDGLIAKIKAKAASPGNDTYLCIAVGAGVVCGFVAYLYSSAFELLLRLVWEVLPERVVMPLLQHWSAVKYAWIFTIAAATLMGTMAGLTQRILGFPGDLPDTVECIHHKVRHMSARAVPPACLRH